MYSRENIKIGARILTEKQATVLLPNYLKINNQINQFREEAKRFNENFESMNVDDYQRYEMYTNFDNVISILGERGSGKTSVFLTLKKVHDFEYKNKDITLPLIVPDNLGDTSDALGWIISYLEKYVEELHPDLKANERKSIAYYGSNKCLENEDSELRTKYKKLRKTYEIRKKIYLNKILERDEGTKEYLSDKAKMTQADQSLIVDFNNFINALVIAKKKLNFNKEIEPLILVFFDDVDISAHRCPEVLETIRNYLNHPNIVVFVSGDFKVFSEIICLEFLRKEGVNSEDYNKIFVPVQQLQEKEVGSFSALELRKERSQEYLKKVLPPSFRFYMKKLSDRDKSNFSYEFVERNTSNNPTLSELISKIENKGNKISWGIGDRGGELLINNETIPYAFFGIFDDNPRGLINPYYYLYQKVHLSENQQWDISDINQFLQIILNSSVKFQKHKEIIANIIVINESSPVISNPEFLVYINYDVLLDLFLQNSLNNSEESIIIEEFTILYILCLFFEKLMKLVIPNYFNYPSGNLLSKILNHKNENLFPDIADDELLLHIYSAFDNKVPLNSNKIFIEEDRGTQRLEQVYFETLNKFVVVNTNYYIPEYDSFGYEGLIYLFQLVFQKDENWVKNKIKFINNKGKSYREIYFDVIELVENKLSFIDEVEKIHLIPNYMSSEYLLNKEYLEGRLHDYFEKLEDAYSDFKGMLQIEMKHFIKSGLDLERLIQQKDTLITSLNFIDDQIELITNQVKVTEEELVNIGKQENLIKTRKRMLNKIKELEAFTQNELRKEEWDSFKKSFIIMRESLEDIWIDQNDMETDQIPDIIFDPKKLSKEYEKLIQENLEGLTRVGIIVKDKHLLIRQDIIKFIEKYFMEEQESLLLKAHLPLDIEGRRKQINDWNSELDILFNEFNRVKSEKRNTEMQIENINLQYDFEVSESLEVSGGLQNKFKDYLLSSIYQQTKGILRYGDRDLKLKTEELLEILKVYEESIEEAKNFLSDSEKPKDFESTMHEDSLDIKLDADDRAMLRTLLKRKDLSNQVKQIASDLQEKEIMELHVDSISRLIKELKKYQDGRFGVTTLLYRTRITNFIRKLEEYKNKPYNIFNEGQEFLKVTLPALNDIIAPYIYTKVLVEDKRINEEKATVYCRELKKELEKFVFQKRNENEQTRFVRYLEKKLFVE